MKVIYEKAIEVNNDLKLNVHAQQDYIKKFKEQCDIYNEDEVEKIKNARNFMKNNQDVHLTCNQTFAITNRLKIYPGRAH